VLHLTEGDIELLGISTIGDKIRLKEKCRELITGNLKSLMIIISLFTQIEVTVFLLIVPG